MPWDRPHVVFTPDLDLLNQEHLVPPELVPAFVLHNLEPEDRAMLAAAMPSIITLQLVPITWRARWQPMDPFLLPKRCLSSSRGRPARSDFSR
jgi:hypothetical protein